MITKLKLSMFFVLLQDLSIVKKTFKKVPHGSVVKVMERLCQVPGAKMAIATLAEGIAAEQEQ